MAAIVGPADALMKAAGKLVGNFKVQMRYKKEENDAISLNKFSDLTALPETLEQPNNTEAHAEVYHRALLYNAQIAELQRHQDNFNPVGGLAAAGVVILLAYSVANMTDG